MPGTRNPPNKFKKGDINNPRGRPKLPEHLKDIKKLTKDELNATFSRYARMTKDELIEVVRSSTTPSIETWICTGILSGIKNGDWYNLNLMCNRLFGLANTSPSIELPNNTSPVTVYLPANGKEAQIVEGEVSEAEPISED